MAGSVSSEDGDIGFQIAPMVDVVFVLMLFFMASAGLQVTERELPYPLPGTMFGETVVVTVFIDIAPNGEVSINGAAYDTTDDRNMPELKAYLKATVIDLAQNPESQDPVVIRPSPETIHERIIDVLNAAAEVGVKKLTFN